MDDAGGPPRSLSAEAMPIFNEGISLILTRWSALQMAVQNEWGGRESRQKADQLCSDIFSWFTQSREPLYIDDLENMLDDSMIALNTMAEDGSVEEVAEKLIIMHEECLEGNFRSIESLRETNHQRVALQHVRQVVNDDDDDDDDDDEGDDINHNNGSSNMILDVPETQSNSNPVDMPVDDQKPRVAAEAEDGWTVVAPRKNRGKKN